MRINATMKLLLGTAAVALSSGAFAQITTNTNPGTGTVFLTINDDTTGASYLFDTGLNALSFSANTSYNNSIAGDANYQAFLAQEGSTDTITYSVLGGSGDGATSDTEDFTNTKSVTSTKAVSGANINQAFTALGQYVSAADAVASSVPNSELATSKTVNSPANEWNGSSGEATFNSKLGINDGQAIGTAVNFFTETGTALSSAVTKGTLSQIAGTWDLTSTGTLSYTPTSPVPLPTPVLLLLSGLGLMGVVARRGKNASADVGMGAAA
jgi:hypothetical protein